MDWSEAIHSSPRSLESRERRRTWLTAFSLQPLAGDDVMTEQALGDIAAYYDPRSKKIVMPRAVGAEHREDLAHEIGHALADRKFDIRKLDTGSDDDRAGAVWALVEGDAGAVAEMWGGMRSTLYPPSAILADVAREATSSVKKSVPVVLRYDVEFTYLGGLRFVAALHRLGGFPLVDRAWAAPPRTTEQVLHPRKYIAGENEIPVRFPALTADRTLALEGRMGELGIRTVLGTCLDDESAELANGWGGDAYRVLRNGDGRLALEWAIAWDDEASAIRFAGAKERLLTCWSKTVARDEASGAKLRLADGAAFVRRGSSVAIVRGAGETGGPLVDESFAAVGAKVPDSPPLGTVAWIEDGEPLVEPSARLVGRRYDVSAFGVAFDVPGDVAAKIEGNLSIEVTDANDYFGFAIDMAATDQVDAVVDRWVERREKQGDGRAVAEGSSAIDTPLGEGWERRWTMGPVRLRAITVPVCAGMRTVLLTSAYGGHTSFARYQMMIASLSRVGDDPPRGCR
jgi:hypothetical protein